MIVATLYMMIFISSIAELGHGTNTNTLKLNATYESTLRLKIQTKII